MKLSEAIRVGAKIRPQARGALYEHRHRFSWSCLIGKCKPERTSCALGAAFEAADCGSHLESVPKGTRGLRGTNEGGVQMTIHQPRGWDAVLLGSFYCPQCRRVDEGRYLIPHLNDDHRWKREEIALWVARLESACNEVASLVPEDRLQQEEEKLGYVTLENVPESFTDLSLEIQRVEQHGQASYPNKFEF